MLQRLGVGAYIQGTHALPYAQAYRAAVEEQRGDSDSSGGGPDGIRTRLGGFEPDPRVKSPMLYPGFSPIVWELSYGPAVKFPTMPLFYCDYV